MFLLVPDHLGCPGQNPESHKMVVCVCTAASTNIYCILLNMSGGRLKTRQRVVNECNTDKLG